MKVWYVKNYNENFHTIRSRDDACLSVSGQTRENNAVTYKLYAYKYRASSLTWCMQEKKIKLTLLIEHNNYGWCCGQPDNLLIGVNSLIFFTNIFINVCM